MDARHGSEKSCDVQLIDSIPQKDWEIDQLGSFARDQDQAIRRGEASLTKSYWRLGLSLNLTRRNFSRGQWGKYLEELGIDKTRASKACAIHRTLKSEARIGELTVREAYRHRQRKPRKLSSKRHRKKNSDGIAQWLMEVCRRADFYLDEASCADSDKAASLLPAVESAIGELTGLRDRLQQRTSKS